MFSSRAAAGIAFALASSVVWAADEDELPECSASCPQGTRKANFRRSEVSVQPGAILITTATCELICAPEQLCILPSTPKVKDDIFTCDVISGFSSFEPDEQVDLSFGSARPFGVRATITFTDRPAFVLVGDFNEDQKDDLISVTTRGNQASLALHASNGGTFAAPAPIAATPSPNIFGASPLAAGDFDGDGHLDIAYPFQDANGCAVAFVRGDGAGGFSAPDVALTPADAMSCSQLQVADLDADGRTDLVTATGERLEIWWGPFGDPAVAVPTPISTSSFSSVTIADFRGDGTLELFSSSSFAAAPFALFTPSGMRMYTTATPNVTGGSPAFATYGDHEPIADYNGDGRDDFLVLGHAGPGRRQVLPGNDDGTFGPLEGDPFTMAECGPEPLVITVGDVDDDSHVDLACVGDPNMMFPPDHKTIWIYRGRGGARFAPAASAVLEANVSQIVAGRFDGHMGPLEIGALSSDGQRFDVVAQ